MFEGETILPPFFAKGCWGVLLGRKRVSRDVLLTVPLHSLGHSEVMLPEGSKVCVQFLSSSEAFRFHHLHILEWWTHSVRSWTIQGILSPLEALALFRRLERVCREGNSCRTVRGFHGELWRSSIWFLVSTATAVGTCVELDMLILWLIFWGDPA